MRSAFEDLTTPTLGDQTLIFSACKIHPDQCPSLPMSPPKERRAVYYERLAANRWNPLPTATTPTAPHRTEQQQRQQIGVSSALCALSSSHGPSILHSGVRLSVHPV